MHYQRLKYKEQRALGTSVTPLFPLGSGQGGALPVVLRVSGSRWEPPRPPPWYSRATHSSGSAEAGVF